MSEAAGSVIDLVERIHKKGLGPLDLLTAETEDGFEKAFNLWLERAVVGLEGNKDKFAGLDEEGLSGVLQLALNMPGLTVTRETNSNGHVDLTIEVGFCSPMRRKLGEAKIYSGLAYHVKGLHQLLGRYTTGREGRGLLIVYVKKANVAGLMKGLRDGMDKDHPEQQKGSTVDHSIKWSFISSHAHSCGEVLEVGHIGCNLFVCDGQGKQ